MSTDSTSTDTTGSDEVRERYAAAARRAMAGQTRVRADDDPFGSGHYRGDETAGLPVATSMGCGNPLAVAELREGETVLDLGSGGGLDVLLSARRVGPAGRAIGLDMTDDMLTLARGHAAEAGVTNAEFHKGQMEDIPLPDASVDVVISNCVIALSTDTPAVFAEIARVLRPGGRLGITDLIAHDTLTDAERTAGTDIECLATARTAHDYRSLLHEAGLLRVEVRATHEAGDKLHSAIIRATKPAVRIAPMTEQHAAAVLDIYQAGIDTGDATFETTAPDWPTWHAAHLPDHRLVALDDAGRVLGWAAVSPVSSRRVYAGVVEHGVYVAPDARRRGVGTTLLDALIAVTEQAGIWTLQSGIFPENTTSRVLHRRAGFREIGIRHHIGRHHGQWRDVIAIERRSPTIGTS
ncbi:MAG TPA: GNAT family N-acetyltransferase [Actinophytocola sp.]|jgi:L-amino acid N-acyltransferase YncA/2-polyprenyl-3-methyl-5-hydroxy-6-metoxy-1,4-benzoquinol methylase|nr:GNAT family N-acetyltransferase [Actinophytocola sp.]